jgi:hypothetical protein
MKQQRKSTRSGRPAGQSSWLWRGWLVFTVIVGGTGMWTYLVTRQLRRPEAPPLQANGLRVSALGGAMPRSC